MKRYYKYIKPKLIFFILSPFFMFVEVYCDVKIPLLAAQIINVGVTTGNHAYILHTTGVMFLYLLLAVCSGSTSAYCAAKASSFFAGDLREDLFIKIQQFSFATIDKFSPGSLVTRLTNDITQMQNLVTMCLRLMCRAPGMLIGALIMAFTINTKIALIFVVLIPILATVIVLVLLAAYKRFMLLQVKIDALNSNIREFLTNIRLVKSLTREDFETQKFKSVNADLKETGLGAFRITVLQMPIMVFIVNLATIAIIWFGSKALDANELLVGDISAFITYLAQILMSVMMLAMLILQSSRAMASSKRITEVLDTDIDIKDGTTSDCTRTVTGGEIEFKKVCFKYFKDTPKPVLDTVSVRIKSGESVGIIGPTGCGKTSFVHLIPRLYDTDSGSVYVDGINVKDYTLENLRAGIAVVLQNNVLFSGSIKENLLWGDKKACDKDIERVADWSAAADFIQLQEHQYETQLGQGGVNLSGGQKQRLCIARAMLKKPKILILDDATSAVDTATERKITAHLKNDLGNVTKIIIAQRITSVIDCDLIIVMNDGKIDNMGKHEDLLQTCEIYNDIYKSQTSKDVAIHE